jgi:predicted ABC-type transport system involved in lysophospholipase L1 biosynthesis ATPase subunit
MTDPVTTCDEHGPAPVLENQPVIVEVRNVNKAYLRGSHIIPVLQEINFDIREGEFLALMGPSGSGKSTLLNLIAGIDKVDSGTIVIGGVDITALDETGRLMHFTRGELRSEGSAVGFGVPPRDLIDEQRQQ